MISIERSFHQLIDDHSTLIDAHHYLGQIFDANLLFLEKFVSCLYNQVVKLLLRNQNGQKQRLIFSRKITNGLLSLTVLAFTQRVNGIDDVSTLQDNRDIWEDSPPVPPAAVPHFDSSEIAPHLRQGPGPTKGQPTTKMFKQRFLDYFAAQPKSHDVPMKKLMSIVAEVCAEAAEGNHRFSLYEIKDGCFLRNVLFKTKLAEHGIDITKSTASLISRHGWITGTRNNEGAIQELEKKIAQLEKNIQGRRGFFRKQTTKAKHEIENNRDRGIIRDYEREIERLRADSKKVVPRWTFHSVAVIQTDQGPVVFDPDVKTLDQRFNCDLTSSFSDWMKYNWGNYDPHFVLAPYNYTQLNHFDKIPPTPHSHGDKTYGHLFDRLPNDPIWKTDPHPPVLLEKNAEGKIQPYYEGVRVKVGHSSMRRIQFKSKSTYGNEQCKKLRPRSDGRLDCFKNVHRTYCNEIYDYETEGETDSDEIRLAQLGRDKCLAKLSQLDRSF